MAARAVPVFLSGGVKHGINSIRSYKHNEIPLESQFNYLVKKGIQNGDSGNDETKNGSLPYAV